MTNFMPPSAGCRLRVSAPFPGGVRQFGYVVADFDRTLEGWLGAGPGPWFVLRGLVTQKTSPR